MKKLIAAEVFIYAVLIMTACATGGASTPAVVQQPSLTPAVIPVPDGLEYEVVDGRRITITGYTGNAVTLEIPAQIQGLPVTAVGDWAFAGSILTSITIPSSVMSIGDYALYYCSSLTNVTMPSSITSIGERAFRLCRRLTSITIPSSVTSIGNEAFSFCSGLTSVTIPSSVTSIGDGAFSYCGSLTSVTIPSSVTSIGDLAFYLCNSLTNFTVDSRNPSYASIDGILFDKNIRTIIAYPKGKTARTYTIPSSVTSIGKNAFHDCSSLTNVTIPSSVTSIGERAFYYCSNLTSVTIPPSVTSIGDYAFSNCRSLTSVTLSRRTQVGQEAFPETARITYRD